MKNIILSIGIFMSLSAFAQNECTIYLPGENIISLAEDANYLWLGTFQSGLCRMDKVTLEKTYFTADNTALPANFVSSILVDDHWLYISIDNSNTPFTDEGGSFWRLHTEDLTLELLGEDIAGIIKKQTGSNHLYILSDYSLYTYYPITVGPSWGQVVPITGTIVANHCCSQNTAFDFDHLGNIWMAHSDFYFYATLSFRNNGSYWLVYTRDNSPMPIESFQQNGLVVDDEGAIWMSNWGGIQRFNNAPYPDDEWTIITNYDPPLIDGEDTLAAPIITLGKGADGRIWMGSSTSYNAVAGEIIAGHISFYNDEGWHLLPTFTDSIFNVNTFHPSTFDTNILYAGTDKGLAIVDIECMDLITGLATDETIEHQNSKMQISPNPATVFDHISIQIDDFVYAHEVEIIISDINGHTVHQQIYPVDNNKQVQLGALGLASGLYIVEVSNEKQKSVQKLVISK